MGMPDKGNYFNVTVVDRDLGTAFCGGKAVLFLIVILGIPAAYSYFLYRKGSG